MTGPLLGLLRPPLPIGSPTRAVPEPHTEPDTALSPSGDGDIVNNMYEPDPDLLAGESAEDETEDSIMSPIPMGPASPFPTSEDFTPKEGSPYEAPVYIPEDIPIPPDFELRESSVPGAGLGVWAKRRMEPGERFGPYMVAPRATLKEADFGWEVSVPRWPSRAPAVDDPAEQPRPRAPAPGGRLGGSEGAFGRRVSQARFVLRLG